MSSIAKGSHRYYSVGVMRFIAAAAIVLGHAIYYTGERLAPPSVAFPMAGNGVDLFFVISGFVMVVSSESLADKPDGWKRFAIHRLVRIVPLYWAATTLKLLVALLTTGLALHASVNIWNSIASYLFIPSYNGIHIHPIFHPGWTLNFEMFFYTLFAISLWLFKRISIPLLGTILAICAALSAIRYTGEPALFYYFDTIVLDFFLGVVIAAYRRHLTLGLPAGVILTVIGAILLFVVPIGGPKGFVDGLAADGRLPRIVTTGLPAALLLLGGINLEPLFRGRDLPALDTFADMSYALYLVPPLLVPAVPHLMRKFGLIYPDMSVVLVTIASFICAAAAYYLYDRPVTRLLRAHVFSAYFSGRRPSAGVDAASPVPNALAP